METKIIDKTQLNILIDALKKGKVVAFPTDTVYGIACNLESQSIAEMKWVKGRDEKKPFPLMVSSTNQIERIAEVTPLAKIVIEHFMPGALTIVLRKKENLADEITNGMPTVAIRMPDEETALKILELAGPLLVTSANRSGCPSAHTQEEVLQQLDGRISVLLSGSSRGSAASTLVDCTGETPKILREGPITLEMIEAFLK